MTDTYRIAGGGTAGLAPHSRADELPRFFPELEPTYEVRLSPGTTSRIHEEIRTNGRGRETGGWLFCQPNDSSAIVAATGPGSDGRLGSETVLLGSEELDAVKRIAPHLELTGDWHIHPTGDTLPSDTDRRAWWRGCQLTRSHWVSLVFAPATSMWTNPRFDAYITCGSRETFFCERLRAREM